MGTHWPPGERGLIIHSLPRPGGYVKWVGNGMVWSRAGWLLGYSISLTAGDPNPAGVIFVDGTDALGESIWADSTDSIGLCVRMPIFPGIPFQRGLFIKTAAMAEGTFIIAENL